MKNLRKFVAVVLATGIMSTSLIPTQATEITTESATSYEFDFFGYEDHLNEELPAYVQEARRLMEIQSRAVEAYNIIMEDFLSDEGGLIYPDTYAGAFVDYDTLVIQLTDISYEETSFYTNLLGNDAPIRFKEVMFSLNQLNTFGRIFTETLNAEIVSIGVDIMANTFSIELDIEHEDSVHAMENINTFKRFMPIPIDISSVERVVIGPAAIEMSISPATVEMGISPAFTNFNVHGGDRINVGSLHGSLGFFGTFNGRDVALISGHVAILGSGGQPVVNIIHHATNQSIGTLSSNFQLGTTSGGGDWAIVDLNAYGRAVANNRVARGSVTIQDRILTIPVGAMAEGFGGASNVRYFGTVSALRDVFTPENIPGRPTFTGQIFVNRSFSSPVPLGGDSGGPIWSMNAGRVSAAGILTGTRGTDIFVFNPFVQISPRFEPLRW